MKYLITFILLIIDAFSAVSPSHLPVGSYDPDNQCKEVSGISFGYVYRMDSYNRWASNGYCSDGYSCCVYHNNVYQPSSDLYSDSCNDSQCSVRYCNYNPTYNYSSQLTCEIDESLNLNNCSCYATPSCGAYQHDDGTGNCVDNDPCTAADAQVDYDNCMSNGGNPLTYWYDCYNDPDTGEKIETSFCEVTSSSSTSNANSSSINSSSFNSSTNSTGSSSSINSSSATSYTASSNGSVASVVGSSSSSGCPSDPCPAIQQHRIDACEAQGGTNDYGCTYDTFSCSYNLTGYCYNSYSSPISNSSSSLVSSSGGTVSSSASSISSSISSDSNLTEILEELKDFHSDNNDNLSDINESINELSDKFKVGILDPCKAFDRNSHFVESSAKPYTWMTDSNGDQIYGYCDCDTCYIIDNINYSEHCIPDPFCSNSSSSSSTSSNSSSDYSRQLSDINNTLNNQSDILDDIRLTNKDINVTIKKSFDRNHNDLGDINQSIVSGFSDLNKTLAGLDFNASGIIDTLNQDTNYSFDVVDSVSQIETFLENVESDIQTIQQNFTNTQNIFSQPLNYSISSGQEPVFSTDFHGQNVEIKLCDSFSTFSPIVSLFVQLSLLIVSARIFWAGIKFSLTAHK